MRSVRRTNGPPRKRARPGGKVASPNAVGSPLLRRPTRSWIGLFYGTVSRLFDRAGPQFVLLQPVRQAARTFLACRLDPPLPDEVIQDGSRAVDG